MSKITYSDEIASNICTYITAGATLKHACACAGVSLNTFNGWLRKGREGVEAYANLPIMIEKAQGTFLAAVEGSLSRKAMEEWKAAAWLLERRDPEQYGRKEKVTHSGAVGHAHFNEPRALKQSEADSIRARVLGLSREEVRDMQEKDLIERKKFGLGD